MENQETPNPKYVELKEHLKNLLKTAKKLGLQIRPGGGYAMGYDMNNLPPYAVGLFGALSIVEGQGARCKLGLSFEETESLEAGFNGNAPRTTKKKFKVNRELMLIGTELRQYVHKEPQRVSYRQLSDTFGQGEAPSEFAAPPIMPIANPTGEVFISAGSAKKKKAVSMGTSVQHTITKKAQPGPSFVGVDFSDGPSFVTEPADQIGAAAKKIMKEKKLAQLAADLQEANAAPAPSDQEAKIKAVVTDALQKEFIKQLNEFNQLAQPLGQPKHAAFFDEVQEFLPDNDAWSGPVDDED